MRNVRFTLLPGAGGGDTPTEGSVADLVRAIPYLLVARIVPPVDVLNEVLATGESDAGMSGGCTWTPFVLTPAEWSELVPALTAEGERSVRFVDPPDWVSTFEEWRYWTYEYCYGIPAEHNLAVGRRIAELEEQKRSAEREGDQDRALRLLSEISRIAQAHSEWVSRHRRPHIWEGEP